MAYDEVVNTNLGTLSGYAGASYLRWVRAAMQARAGAYTVPLFFADLVGQFVHGWDTWNTVMTDSVLESVPTIVLRGSGTGTMGGLRTAGFALVRPRLTGLGAADFQAAPLDGLNTGGQIAGGDITVGVGGDFDGRLDVSVDSGGVAVGADTYRGLISYRPAGAIAFEPLAWLYATVTP